MMKKFSLKQTIMAAVIAATSGVNVFGSGTDPFADIDGFRAATRGFTAAIETHVTDLQKENRSLKTQISQLSTASTEVTRLNGELTNMTTAKDAAEIEVTRLNGELTNMTTAKTAAEAEVTRLTTELANMTTSVTADVTRLTAEKAAAEADVTRLNGELTNMTTAKTAAEAEVARLNGELTSMTTAKAAAEADVARLTAEKAEVEQKLQRRESDYDSMKRRYEGIEEYLKGHIVQLQESIEKMKPENLDQIRFDVFVDLLDWSAQESIKSGAYDAIIQKATQIFTKEDSTITPDFAQDYYDQFSEMKFMFPHGYQGATQALVEKLLEAIEAKTAR